jgi:hypothetical protein
MDKVEIQFHTVFISPLYLGELPPTHLGKKPLVTSEGLMNIGANLDMVVKKEIPLPL